MAGKKKKPLTKKEWTAKNKEREKHNKKRREKIEEESKREVGEEEHNERVEMLKKMGIIK